MSCLSCGRNFHEECDEHPSEWGDGSCCCYGTDEILQAEAAFAAEAPITRRRENVGVSAGRKRAAADYPIDKDAPCEWRMQANCGGGFAPILGCISGYQRHRHHGPDKRTTSNERTNISLICYDCHNRWHTANDDLYGGEKCPVGIKPKEHRPMTPEEVVQRAMK